MNFWFTTCNPCVGELAELDALNKELAEKGGALIGVNTFTLGGDEAAISEAKDVLAKKGVTYQNVYFDSDGEAGKFAANIFAYPTTYVVDRNGNIVGDRIRRRHCKPKSTRHCPPIRADPRFSESVYDEEKHRKPAHSAHHCIASGKQAPILSKWPLKAEPEHQRGFIFGDPCSIKQVLDEHLFLQRRFRCKVFALIRSRKAPS